MKEKHNLLYCCLTRATELMVP